MEIGQTLKTYGSISSEIFVTTKVPCCTPALENFGQSHYCTDPETQGTVQHKMERNNFLLGVSRTNLTLLHFPCPSFEHTVQQWLELEAGLAAGLTDAIGVSNFNHELLAKLAADNRTKITPATNQCSHAIGHHNNSEANAKHGSDYNTVAYCKQHGISYSAYSPMGGLSGVNVWDIPEVKTIAQAHNVSGAQVALKWLVQQNITVVTAAHNPEYIAEDIDLWSFELSAQEMKTLTAI
jgi:diketogulonate reductase-like aldo/keto reductase